MKPFWPNCESNNLVTYNTEETRYFLVSGLRSGLPRVLSGLKILNRLMKQKVLDSTELYPRKSTASRSASLVIKQ